MTGGCAFFRRPICLGAMFLWALALALSCAAQRDAATQGPSRESEKLGLLVGTWKIERTAHNTAYHPTEENQSYTQIGEWFEGHLFVLCRLRLTQPTGPYGKVSVFGYDLDAGTYFCDVYMDHGYRPARPGGPGCDRFCLIGLFGSAEDTWRFR
jgi:hypothetical protein